LAVQEILVALTLAASFAFLVKKLFLHDLLARRRPDVPVGKLVRKKRSSGGPSCH
jgi:hypothetical protein